MEGAPTSSRRAFGINLSLRRDGWFLALAAAVIVADQLSKWGIRSWLDRGERWPEETAIRIVHVTNSGAAFGILQGAGPLLILSSLLGVTAILVFLFNPGFAHPVMRLGLALMFGGAVGNLIDRLKAGEVVDFVKFPYWPAFNVADSAITVGVLCLLWAFLFDLQATEKHAAS